MQPELLSALIAGGVSLIVSLITYITSVRSLKIEREKLERQLERQFTDRLYNLRLINYPEAFKITEPLGKKNTIIQTQEIGKQLKSWKAGEVSLILSNRARQSFYNLQEAINKKPETAKGFSEQQNFKIWKLRNLFRGELRGDLGLLFEEDGDG
jgi:hypothetical protein